MSDQHTVIEVECLEDGCDELEDVTYLGHARTDRQTEIVLDAHIEAARLHEEEAGHEFNVSVETGTPSEMEALYEDLTGERLVADGGVDVERFVEHPSPDRFFMQIEPAEVEMRPMDHDDVTFKSQLVPGGSFGVELTASYTYAGRDCKQHISLDRDAVESLHERLGEILEADHRE